MSLPIKFATIPIKYAPKRKMVNFTAPQWRNKLAEIEDQDVLSFINSAYQDKVFPTQEAFNKAYDTRDTYTLHWGNKPMILTKEDVTVFEAVHLNGAFDQTKPGVIDKLITKMKAALETGEKVIFVY
jgi:hypothetical protein